jgi:dimethylhistidine N-methyltransferase
MTDDANDTPPHADAASTEAEFFAAAHAAPRRSAPTHFRSDVLAGLTATRKTLPSKYFYDARGSRLFEAICELPEYYLTRTETALLGRITPEIGTSIRSGAALVEFGSGASTKTRLLLDAAPQLRYYVPIDISETALALAAEAIASDYPTLEVEPLARDFTEALELPEAVRGAPVVGFFPGSTIGNFPPREASALLYRARMTLGDEALFIVGADLAKDPAVLLRAYDDAQGVTATFNENLLVRINRELAGNFDLGAFRHRAVWNATEGRIEMHLESTRDQTVLVGNELVRFARGESIHTENSYKYLPGHFTQLAARAGWRTARFWSSSEPSFGIFLLTSGEPSGHA